MAATYHTIMEQIRERIETGALRAGARAPSTRQIMREWGVAMATATKALAALQAAGLVRGVVGVGTVVVARPQRTVTGADRGGRSSVGPRRPLQTVAGRPEPGREAGPELTRERIVRTAMAVADAEGIAALSMRRVAVELGVAVMSLYRYVPSREELVGAMVDHVLGETVLPDPPPVGWRERIEVVARAWWDLAHRHPWWPSLISLTRPQWTANGTAQLEWIMRAVRDLGLDARVSLQVGVAIAGLVIGVGASQQLEADAQRDTGLSADEFTRARAEGRLLIAGARYPTNEEFFQLAGDLPTMVEVSSIPGFALRLDDVFELSLGLILDGLSQRIPRGCGSFS